MAPVPPVPPLNVAAPSNATASLTSNNTFSMGSVSTQQLVIIAAAAIIAPIVFKRLF